MPRWLTLGIGVLSKSNSLMAAVIAAFRWMPAARCGSRLAHRFVRFAGRGGSGISRAGGGWPRLGGMLVMSPGLSVIT